MNRSCLLCIDLKWNLKWKVFLPPPPPELQDSSLICSLGISYAVCPHCVRLLLFFFFSHCAATRTGSNKLVHLQPATVNGRAGAGEHVETLRPSHFHTYPEGLQWTQQRSGLRKVRSLLTCTSNVLACVMQIRSRSDSSDILTPPSLKGLSEKKKKKKHWPDCSCVFSDKWEGPEELVYLNICWMTLRCLITVMALA